MQVKIGEIYQENFLKRIYLVKDIFQIKRGNRIELVIYLIEIHPVNQRSSYYTSEKVIKEQFQKLTES